MWQAPGVGGFLTQGMDLGGDARDAGERPIVEGQRWCRAFAMARAVLCWWRTAEGTGGGRTLSNFESG
jgi:hypothetical protein